MSHNQEFEGKKKVLVLYMPVIHNGYLTLLESFKDGEVYILADSITTNYKPLRKDIRSLPAERIVSFLQANNLGKIVEVADEDVLANLNSPDSVIVMPNDEQLVIIAENYLLAAQVAFEDVFLRWDSKKALSQKKLDAFEKTSSEVKDREYMQAAFEEAAKSVDQWRQVGAVLVIDGTIVLKAHNHHLPDDYQPVYAGDPRGNFSKGKHIDISTAQHAEASIVAQAAKEGISLEGADLYITTFACPVCAKLVSETGIKRLFFADGYAMVDGLKVLEESGIEVVRVV